MSVLQHMDLSTHASQASTHGTHRRIWRLFYVGQSIDRSPPLDSGRTVRAFSFLKCSACSVQCSGTARSATVHP
eukprot:1896443-Pleurochrysis_carterae.AAC.1